MDLTERTLESRSIFEGKIVTLLVDQAELPDGKRASREVVLHPGGVAVLPLDEEGNVTLVQQSAIPSTRSSWSCRQASWMPASPMRRRPGGN